MVWTKKKIIGLIAFIVVTTTLPVAIFLVRQQQETRSRATSDVSIAFDPPQAVKTVGETFDVKVGVDGGVENVSYVKMNLRVDTDLVNIIGFTPLGNYAFLSGPTITPSGIVSFELIDASSNAPTGLTEIGVLRLEGKSVGDASLAVTESEMYATGINGALTLTVADPGSYTITSAVSVTPDQCSGPTGLWPEGCACTSDHQCSSQKCAPTQGNPNVSVCVPFLTPTVVISVTPSQTPCQTNTGRPVNCQCANNSQCASSFCQFPSIAPTGGQESGTCQFLPTPSPSLAPTATRTPTPQSTVRISGEHVDKTGAPFSIAGQKVTITNLSTNQTQQTESRPNWQFDNLPRANYRVTASPVNGYSIGLSTCSNCSFHTPNFTNTQTSIDLPFQTNPSITFYDIHFQYSSNITPSPTPTASNTPTPTNTPVPTASTLNVSFKLPGIGTASGDNSSPVKTSRTIALVITNSAGLAVGTLWPGTAVYNPSSGTYEGTVDLGTNFLSGAYTVKIQSVNTLFKSVPNIVPVTAGQQSVTQTVTLINGDMNGDNTLSIADYTSYLSCYKNVSSCTSVMKTAADFNDNGVTIGDTDDLNILQSGFALREGD